MKFLLVLSCIIFQVSSDQVSDRFDWREKGLLAKVKDQGSCDGSFYFAAIGTIESHYYISTSQNIELSEQSTIDCSLGFNNGCNGGGVLNTIDFVRSKGVVPEEDYPYVGSFEDCKMDSSTSLLKTIGYKTLPRDEEELKTTVGTIGPVAVTFRGQNLTSYSGGVYNDPNCRSGTESYSGVVIGYGTSDDGEDYWTIKMSYGASWGENGYIRVARNTDNQCGVVDEAIYPIL